MGQNTVAEKLSESSELKKSTLSAPWAKSNLTNIRQSCILLSSMEFVEQKVFTRDIKKLLTDEELAETQGELLINPEKGELISGTGGLRKLRTTEKARGKGKSGGARIMYLYLADRDRIHLLAVYSKDEQATLTRGEKKQMKKVAQEIKRTDIKQIEVK